MIEWKFRKLSIGADDEKQNYFAMVRLHKDISDFEASAIDLNISRDQRTWKGTGLKRPTTQHANAFKMIYTALTGSGTDSSTEFQVRFTEKGENLEVICSWKEEGKKIFLRHKPLLLERDSSPDASTFIYDSLLQKSNLLEEEVKLGAAKYEGWKRMAEKEAARVKDFVDRKDRHDEEVRLKFAAVLMEKKGHITGDEKAGPSNTETGDAAGDEQAGPSKTEAGYSSNETEASEEKMSREPTDAEMSE